MADNKKSFLFYCDWKDTFEELPKETGYDLLIHLLRYVNDENPVTKDPIVKALFPIIKNQLKRDLDKWEGIKGKRSEAGKESARLRAIKKEQEATNPTSVESVQQSSTNPTVIDNVIVNDTVTVKGKVIKKTKGVIIPFDTDEFINAWDMWKQYKKDEHKFNYKSIISEQAALKSLTEKANGNEAKAILMILQSIENGWKGFFKINSNGKEKLISWN
tara:strand:+ start:180 stop:830 length:651 start_codon:yes stop_codon:yes gene_type:complete